MITPQTLPVFQKSIPSVQKVLEIPAHAISCDVIGLDAGLESDILLERYGPKLYVLQVVCP